jgi:hypothetical protein
MSTLCWMGAAAAAQFSIAIHINELLNRNIKIYRPSTKITTCDSRQMK